MKATIRQKDLKRKLGGIDPADLKLCEIIVNTYHHSFFKNKLNRGVATARAGM